MPVMLRLMSLFLEAQFCRCDVYDFYRGQTVVSFTRTRVTLMAVIFIRITI